MNNLLIANSIVKKNVTPSGGDDIPTNNKSWSRSEKMTCEKIREDVNDIAFFLAMSSNLGGLTMEGGGTFSYGVDDLSGYTTGFKYLIPFFALRSDVNMKLNPGAALGTDIVFKNSSDVQTYRLKFRYSVSNNETWVGSSSADTWVIFNADNCSITTNTNTSTEFECTIKPTTTTAAIKYVSSDFSANNINSNSVVALHSPTYSLISAKNCGDKCTFGFFMENNTLSNPAFVWGFIGAT